MTRDEIIRMAREAGLDVYLGPNWDLFEQIERFAALVAAAEREKTVQIVEEISNKALHAQLQAVAAEREECAKVADKVLVERNPWGSAKWIAAAIRARGQE